VHVTISNDIYLNSSSFGPTDRGMFGYMHRDAIASIPTWIKMAGRKSSRGCERQRGRPRARVIVTS